MKIRDRTVLVYDIEIFPNVFHCIVYDTEIDKYYYFEISERKNDILDLVSLFWTVRDKTLYSSYMFCGYNNIHYDNVIINYMIEYCGKMTTLSYNEICKSLFNLSKTIIESKENSFAKWSKWKYADNFVTLDLLTMLYSQKLRVGLKEMQVTMQFHNVQEYSGDFQDFLPASEIPKMAEYNKNDVDSTTELLNRCKKDIDLRLAIEDEYGVKVLNKDGVNIGMQIIAHKYLEKTGQTWNQIKDLRSPCEEMDLNKVILPFIKYKSPLLQGILEDMKKQTVSAGRKGYEKHFLFGDLEYSVGVGGIHSVNKPEVIKPTKNQMLIDIDVASLYPSIIIQYGFYPPHLGKEFLEVYSKIRDERLEAKHNGNEVKDLTLKLALNGLSGNLQNAYSFCYSPYTVMQIRINGQLMLLMLAENLVELGCKIVQANTDGLFVLLDKDKYQEVNEICKEWEKLTKLELEEDRFEAMYQFAINDYLAIKEGYSETKNPRLIKTKGLFINKVNLGKGMAPIIVPDAIIKYFADGIPIETTITNCKDINKFITYQKVSKEFSVEYNGELIQHINRYYISTNGPWLYKCKVKSKDEYLPAVRIKLENVEKIVPRAALEPGGEYWYNTNVQILEEGLKILHKKGERYGYIKLLTDSGVTIINKLDDIKEIPNNINYRYYISAASKIITQFENKQLTLF